MTNILQKTFEQAAVRITASNDKIFDDFTTEYKRMDAITILLITERIPHGPLVVTGQALIKPPGWTNKDRVLLMKILTEQLLRLAGDNFDGHGNVQFESKRKHDDWKD